MTNREAIGILQANVIYACEKAGLSKAAIRSVEDALNQVISALEKQEADRWIPCSVRLPEIKHHIDDEHFSDEVLVTEWFNGFKKTRIGNFDTRTGWWNDEKGCGFLGVITSWRPLPEPYMEEEA